MRNRMGLLAAVLVLAISIPAVIDGAAAPANWPKYRGPAGDGISTEVGLLKSFPATGPRVVWRAPLGTGYSGVSVVGDRLYTMFGSGGNELVAAFEATTGKELWRVSLGPDRQDGMGGGPRATPTVDGDRVYAIGAEGKLVALAADTGKVRWSVDLVKEYGARVPQWGISSSPVVEGGLLLVNPGGGNDRSFLGLNKLTGKMEWAGESDTPGYSTPVVHDIAGTRQAIFFAGTSLISVSPQNGKRLWSVPWKTSYDVNAAMPVFIAPDKVFISSSYDVGAQLLKVSGSGGTQQVESVWRNRVMKNHFNSSIYFDGHLYGFDDATLKCIDPVSGTERWKARGFGKGSLLAADGHLWVLSDKGDLALVELAPGEYKEKARAKVLEGKTWTMPTIAGKRLYLRTENELVAFDVAG